MLRWVSRVPPPAMRAGRPPFWPRASRADETRGSNCLSMSSRSSTSPLTSTGRVPRSTVSDIGPVYPQCTKRPPAQRPCAHRFANGGDMRGRDCSVVALDQRRRAASNVVSTSRDRRRRRRCAGRLRRRIAFVTQGGHFTDQLTVRALRSLRVVASAIMLVPLVPLVPPLPSAGALKSDAPPPSRLAPGP